MFSLEPDLATGNMVLSQISIVRALLPAVSESLVSPTQARTKNLWMCLELLKYGRISLIPYKRSALTVTCQRYKHLRVCYKPLCLT